MKTVLITGASSGIGKAAARLFQARGWNVAATMRSPEKETELAKLDRVFCAALDVTRPESIREAVKSAVTKFGGLDVAVNNAGYGAVGPFEAAAREQILRQFDTNVFGLMEVTRAVLPHFREQRSGVLINISSWGGRLTFPLYSLYHATKWAVEGFSESLQFELEPFHIRVKLVEPGPVRTDFYSRSADFLADPQLTAYNEVVGRVMSEVHTAGAQGSPPEAVASVVFRAATDGKWKLRYPVGLFESAMLLLRRGVPDRWFHALIRQVLMR